MAYHHASLYQLKKTLKPGERYYICGCRVSQHGTRILKNVPPVLAELCCEKRGSEETWHREHGYPVNYAIPVGQVDLEWNRAHSLSDIAFFKEEKEAEDYYKEALAAAIQETEIAMKNVTKVHSLLQDKLRMLTENTDRKETT